jgi:hypothetical protein
MMPMIEGEGICVQLVNDFENARPSVKANYGRASI